MHLMKLTLTSASPLVLFCSLYEHNYYKYFEMCKKCIYSIYTFKSELKYCLIFFYDQIALTKLIFQVSPVNAQVQLFFVKMCSNFWLIKYKVPLWTAQLFLKRHFEISSAHSLPLWHFKGDILLYLSFY